MTSSLKLRNVHNLGELPETKRNEIVNSERWMRIKLLTLVIFSVSGSSLQTSTSSRGLVNLVVERGFLGGKLGHTNRRRPDGQRHDNVRNGNIRTSEECQGNGTESEDGVAVVHPVQHLTDVGGSEVCDDVECRNRAQQSKAEGDVGCTLSEVVPVGIRGATHYPDCVKCNGSASGDEATEDQSEQELVRGRSMKHGFLLFGNLLREVGLQLGIMTMKLKFLI